MLVRRNTLGSAAAPWACIFRVPGLPQGMNFTGVGGQAGPAPGNVSLLIRSIFNVSPASMRRVGPGIPPLYVPVSISRPATWFLVRQTCSVAARTPLTLWMTCGSLKGGPVDAPVGVAAEA